MHTCKIYKLKCLFKKDTFLMKLSFKYLKKKGTYLRKAAMFPFKESEAFSTFIDLEHT